jgi:hypothetical protein
MRVSTEAPRSEKNIPCRRKFSLAQFVMHLSPQRSVGGHTMGAAFS